VIENARSVQTTSSRASTNWEPQNLGEDRSMWLMRHLQTFPGFKFPVRLTTLAQFDTCGLLNMLLVLSQSDSEPIDSETKGVKFHLKSRLSLDLAVQRS